MKFRPMLRIGTLVLYAMISVPASSGEPARESVRVTMNFQNVDVAVMAEVVSKATDIVIVVDPGIRTPLTLVSDKALTLSELYQAFVRVVSEKGLEIVEADGKATVRHKSQPKSSGNPA